MMKKNTPIMIEKNIPMPTRSVAKLLAREMEISDSVFFEDSTQLPHISRSKSSALCKELRNMKRKGTTKKVEGGLRVWRVE